MTASKRFPISLLLLIRGGKGKTELAPHSTTPSALGQMLLTKMWRRNDKGNDGGCHEDGDLVRVKGADRSSCGSI